MRNRIVSFVSPHSKILDLGCGNGELLGYLKEHKHVKGYGIDYKFEHILECTKRGISSFQGNIDEGLKEFSDQSYDYVILSLTLQQVQKPLYVLRELIRVGKKVVVTFPNFGYWRIRFQALLGHAPQTKILPYEWYDTPNIRIITISDFKLLCKEEKIRIIKEVPRYPFSIFNITGTGLSNLFSLKGIFVLEKLP